MDNSNNREREEILAKGWKGERKSWPEIAHALLIFPKQAAEMPRLRRRTPQAEDTHMAVQFCIIQRSGTTGRSGERS